MAWSWFMSLFIHYLSIYLYDFFFSFLREGYRTVLGDWFFASLAKTLTILGTKGKLFWILRTRHKISLSILVTTFFIGFDRGRRRGIGRKGRREGWVRRSRFWGEKKREGKVKDDNMVETKTNGQYGWVRMWMMQHSSHWMTNDAARLNDEMDVLSEKWVF